MYRVAIVGRPNVGKSTLFNRLTRSRKALVGDEPGITRDRIFEIVNRGGRPFELIDTGGIVPDEKAVIPEKVFEQAELAISDSRLVLLLVDARAGVMPLDREVAAMLQSRGKEFLVVANKVEVERIEAESYQFYEFGVERVFAISAEHGLGIDDLLEEICSRIPESEVPAAENEIRVAIIGRPNVGKSSLVNRILGRERVIVTDIPGTTRDSIDSLFVHNGQSFRVIDTAGIRRKGRTDLMAEKLSVVMARKNLEQADVVLLVIDASEGATKLDATIGGYAHDAGKSVIILVNKWDVVEKDSHTMHQIEEEYRSRMKFLEYAPMLFVSAKTGQRVSRILELAREAHAGGAVKVGTSQFNRLLEEIFSAIQRRQGGSGKSPVKYGCQVGLHPPTFILFLRGSTELHFSKVRHLSNQLRERYTFFASPIRILQRKAKKKTR